MKKFLLAVMSLVLACGIGFAAVGCNNGDTAEDAIVVVTREPGSGTRSAFIELTGIEQDDTDRTIATADIAENTGSLVSLVSRTECAIGYASFGSVVNDESIKMISVDGTAPTTDTIKAAALSPPLFSEDFPETTFFSSALALLAPYPAFSTARMIFSSLSVSGAILWARRPISRPMRSAMPEQSTASVSISMSWYLQEEEPELTIRIFINVPKSSLKGRQGTLSCLPDEYVYLLSAAA